MSYIKSLLDNDLYSFTQQNAILEHYPNALATYKFTNRNTDMKFNKNSYDAIVKNIKALGDLIFTESELKFIDDYKFIDRNYHFKPEQVTVDFFDGDLDVIIHGPWCETVFFEVPLLAIISEAYFEFVDKEWRETNWISEQFAKATEKAEKLATINDKFTDFGTRRRRSYEIQDLVVETLKNSKVPNFFGTSNVHFAHKHAICPVGTMAHQWFMGVSALESLRYANRFALLKWQETYKLPGFALTDTYGTNAFFQDFTIKLANLYSGLRHDSGCPFKFADKAIKHYENIDIDPNTKLIIFSDGLDVQKALNISKHCKGRINCSFGIGTHFSNDINDSKPLNIVIKLHAINGIPVVKLSDDLGKTIGDKDAIRVAKWMFMNQPLDS